MRILVIDNFDSFTFNLVHYLEQFCNEVVVWRTNEVKLEEIKLFDKIILSPGPGLSSEVPILQHIILHFGETMPVLGVCLGHQAIAEAFGGTLINLEEPRHGKSIKTIILDMDDYLFMDFPPFFLSGRYHSWVINKDTIPSDLKITSVDDKDEIMSVSHKKYDIKGVQFHPESIMTEYGIKLIENWVKGRR